MNVADLLVALRRAIRDRVYIARLDVLDQTANVLKARLYISPNLFVQVYRNDRFDTTNLVLIYTGSGFMHGTNLAGSGIVIRPLRLICTIPALVDANR